MSAFMEWFAEMYSSLEDYEFEEAHKITWEEAEKQTLERVIKLLEEGNGR